MAKGSKQKNLQAGDRVMPSRKGLRELTWAFPEGAAMRGYVQRRTAGMEPEQVRVRWDAEHEVSFEGHVTTYHESFITLTLKRGHIAKPGTR